MNFFQLVKELGLDGDLTIVAKSVGEKLIVSVMLTNETCGDAAKQNIKPVLFNGQPADIDAAFFQKISEPFMSTSKLLVSMEDHLSSVVKAKEESAQAKAHADKQKKAYDSTMAKVAELEEAGKYREACSNLPDPMEFPDKESVITKKRNELMLKFSQPNLFENA